MKGTFALMAILLPGFAIAQIPDVLIHFEPLFNIRSDRNGKTTFQLYDALGNYGTVGLSFNLEPGFRVLVSQRLQKIDGNADDDQLDLLYIEDRGYWRLGKQILPFGRNGLLKESVYGARYETNLGWEALPASLSACDGGAGLQRGFMGRIGTRLGFSFAFGERFGIDASSLTVIRRPEDSPGKHRGFKQILGVDYSRKIRSLILRAEHAWFRKGQTALDEDFDVTDVSLSFEPDMRRAIVFGYARQWAESVNEFRLHGKFPAREGAWIEPIILIREASLRSIGVSVRMRF